MPWHSTSERIREVWLPISTLKQHMSALRTLDIFQLEGVKMASIISSSSGTISNTVKWEMTKLSVGKKSKWILTDIGSAVRGDRCCPQVQVKMGAKIISPHYNEIDGQCHVTRLEFGYKTHYWHHCERVTPLRSCLIVPISYQKQEAVSNLSIHLILLLR